MPTAAHEVAAVQDSQNSWPVGTVGLGLGVIDQPAPEALAGVARAPTRSTADTSKMNLFIAIPSPNPAQAPASDARILAPRPHKKLTRADLRLMRLPDLPFSGVQSGQECVGAHWGGGAVAVIDYRLLGPIEAGVDGRVLDIGGQKQRTLLAVLVLSADQPVSRDELVDRLWGERPPAGAQHTLEVYISRLRKTLEPAAGGPVVLARPGAYVLQAAGERIDLRRFERLAGEGRRALAGGAPGRAAAVLREALALWRGAPLADGGDEPVAQAEIARLEELPAGVLEDRIEADLALSRHADVVSELEALAPGCWCPVVITLPEPAVWPRQCFHVGDYWPCVLSALGGWLMLPPCGAAWALRGGSVIRPGGAAADHE